MKRDARSTAATLVMLLIALRAAVLSFNTLAEVGSAPGLFPKPWGGWLWAGSVDGFITLGFLSIPAGGRQALYARVQIIVGFAASLIFQLAHAQGIVWPLAVAAIPPIAVVLSVEAWWLSRDHPAEASTYSSGQSVPAEASTYPIGEAGRVLVNSRRDRTQPLNGQASEPAPTFPFATREEVNKG